MFLILTSLLICYPDSHVVLFVPGLRIRGCFVSSPHLLCWLTGAVPLRTMRRVALSLDRR